MKPRILMLGGEKGSWEVRGKQIGAALGATVTNQPRRCDWVWADLVICVKQGLERFGEEARFRHLPVIWDALDYWPQPQGNGRTEAEAVTDLHRRLALYRPTLRIGATQAMAATMPGVYIPHHHRPGLMPTPPRTALRTVAYEGRVKYVTDWLKPLETACARLGAQFAINPASILQADVVVAVRGTGWDGWACRQWKSGVKYVNAIVAGKPVVTQPSAAWTEIEPTGVTIDNPQDAEAAILAAWQMRSLAYAQGLRRKDEFSLGTIVGQYRQLIRSALRVAA